jgi:hypothetical protein
MHQCIKYLYQRSALAVNVNRTKHLPDGKWIMKRLKLESFHQRYSTILSIPSCPSPLTRLDLLDDIHTMNQRKSSNGRAHALSTEPGPMTTCDQPTTSPITYFHDVSAVFRRMFARDLSEEVQSFDIVDTETYQYIHL